MATSLTPSEAALSCGICLSEFDATLRRPLVLPKCGHTFCRTCVKNLAVRGDVFCPVCRYKYQDVEPDELPINFNIQTLAATGKQFPKITKTDDPSGTDCREHGVRLAFWCKTCEVAACGECLYDQHPLIDHNTCRIHEVVQQIKELAERMSRENCEEIVVRLGATIRGTLEHISDLQEAAHLMTETARVNRSAVAAKDLAAITSVFETAKGIQKRVSALDRSREGARAESEAVGVSSARPSLLALSDNGCLSRVEVEAKGIHIYSLRPASTAYSVAIKLNVLTACVSKESPTVFMDILAGERCLGRVYIALDGKMKRSQQFMALCLGSMGYSYRNTKFDEVNDRGQPGEYLRGGDYQGQGGLGGDALMDNLEWGGTWTKSKTAGQVCGVGGQEERKFGSLFAICLKDNPEDSFKCPFGSVTEGLSVLEVALRHDPFNVVRIGECGVVIPL